MSMSEMSTSIRRSLGRESHPGDVEQPDNTASDRDIADAVQAVVQFARNCSPEQITVLRESIDEKLADLEGGARR